MPNTPSGRRAGDSRWRTVWLLVTAAIVGAVAVWVWSASSASAHVVPASTVQLAIGDTTVEATVAIPVSDVAAATGLDLGEGTQADVDAQSAVIMDYLRDHIKPTSTDGQPWTVAVGEPTVTETGDPATTGRYQQLITHVILIPASGTDLRSFDLGYSAIVDKVATHTVIVTVDSDAAHPDQGAYQLGVIKRDTVTNTVTSLPVDLSSSSTYQGFASMISLGMHHIAEGTDHQLFLLTLLLPAPLIATARRWRGPVPTRRAVRRIATVTIAFTLGHSLTLALGALGLPVWQGLVEAMIALSILVAAVHAIRPIFPGREALVAGAFGLVHGLAFSETLRELDLTGTQLVGALLGFNLGIEAMQLMIVAAVLPPLILLARADRYRRFRIVAATVTAVAAIGWLAARLGYTNPVADLADRLGSLSIPVVVGVWLAALVINHRSQSTPQEALDPTLTPSR